MGFTINILLETIGSLFYIIKLSENTKRIIQIISYFISFYIMIRYSTITSLYQDYLP